MDYTRSNFTETDVRYDLIFDIAASQSLAACKRILAPEGHYVACSGGLGWLFKVVMSSLVRGWVTGPWVASSNPEDLGVLNEWVAAGRIKPVVVRTIGLDDIPEALREQGEGHSQGKTVISE